MATTAVHSLLSTGMCTLLLLSNSTLTPFLYLVLILTPRSRDFGCQLPSGRILLSWNPRIFSVGAILWRVETNPFLSLPIAFKMLNVCTLYSMHAHSVANWPYVLFLPLDVPFHPHVCTCVSHPPIFRVSCYHVWMTFLAKPRLSIYETLHELPLNNYLG